MARQPVGYSQWFIMEVSRCAHDGHVAMMRDCTFEPFYLYFKRGSLKIAQTCPEGYQLGTGERVPSNVDEQGLTAWVHRNSTRLECLPD